MVGRSVGSTLRQPDMHVWVVSWMDVMYNVHAWLCKDIHCRGKGQRDERKTEGHREERERERERERESGSE